MHTNQKLRVKYFACIPVIFVSKMELNKGAVYPLFSLQSIWMNCLVKLEEPQFGCHFGKDILGILPYADNIALLAPSVSSVNIMLSAVCEFGKDFEVNFKTEKTQLLIYGDSQKI